MGTRLDRVVAWLDDVRRLDVAPLCPHLSPAGARGALDAALASLGRDDLARAVARPGRPFPRAAMVVARTVFTAPIEWAAVLLGRGTQLALKPSSDDRGFADALVAAAEAHGLPLSATDDRAVVRDAPLVIVMGSDATVRAIGAEVTPGTRYLGFGHRFGAAFLTTADGFAALGPDLALHDGLGCMSPAAVFTDWPTDDALDALSASWQAITERLPAGPLAGAAAARIREREALARVLGRVGKGPGWAVHVLPITRFAPVALPRSVVLHATVHRDEVARLLGDHSATVSTFATDDPSLAIPEGARRCRPGEMQQPPLDRLHDGVDWLSATLDHHDPAVEGTNG
ncbi:MAG: acyl-CoA reductase [Myxococcota bacterium]